MERFRTLTRNYYRSAHISVLIYSLDDPSSLHFLPKWIDDTKDFAPNALKVLVGNKADLTSKVPEENVQDFASIYNCDMVFRVSAKTGEGIEDALAKIAEKMLDTLKKEECQGGLFDEKDRKRLTDESSGGSGCGC